MNTAPIRTAPASAPISTLDRLRRLRRELITPELIYGTILVSAIIVIAEDGEDDLTLLTVVAVTSVVFWVAHVFAATIAHHEKRDGRGVPIGESLRHAMHHSLGLLLAAIFPVFWLTLGWAGALTEEDAYTIALLGGVILLFIFGALAFAERGRRWYWCLVAGLATALLGTIVILLKAVLH